MGMPVLEESYNTSRRTSRETRRGHRLVLVMPVDVC